MSLLFNFDNCNSLDFQLGNVAKGVSVSATYSSVPNRRAGPNKRAGGKILEKKINVQDRIDVQGDFFF